MKRRNFIYNSSLLALSVGVFGNIKWNGTSFTGEDPTTTDILGPFYRPGAPFRTNLIHKRIKGQTLHFSGTVFAKDGKTPLSNSLVEIWHCNENGTYDNTSMSMCTVHLPKQAKWQVSFQNYFPCPHGVSKTEVRPAHIHAYLRQNKSRIL